MNKVILLLILTGLLVQGCDSRTTSVGGIEATLLFEENADCAHVAGEWIDARPTLAFHNADTVKRIVRLGEAKLIDEGTKDSLSQSMEGTVFSESDRTQRETLRDFRGVIEASSDMTLSLWITFPVGAALPTHLNVALAIDVDGELTTVSGDGYDKSRCAIP